MIDTLVLFGSAAIGLASWVGIRSHNRLIALDTRCDTAFADIDVQLKHRHSLIPNLVETVRGYAAHEAKVLTEVTQARAAALNSHQPEMRLDAETQLGQTINQLLAVAERYPTLTASPHFAELRAEMADCEHRITAARRFFNMAVDEYNATRQQFPAALFAERMQLGRRMPFDLGVERVILDEPLAVKF